MKQNRNFLCVMGLAVVFASNASALDRDMVRFAAAKEVQAREFSEKQTNKVPSLVWSFFDAVKVDDWKTATNLFARLVEIRGHYDYFKTTVTASSLQTAIWSPIVETIGAYEHFHDWDNKWLHRFGREIIDSIPKGSIYFGGNGSGRFLISALSESHRDGRPFFTLSQNALADRTYLDYLRVIYGKRLYIPTGEDSQQCYNEYLQDAQKRLLHDTQFPNQPKQIKPGEDVRLVNENGEPRVQVSGQMSVIAVYGQIAKVIFDKNPKHEFYVEESFPLEWMYPHLSPHGLIMKLEAKPLAVLPEADLQRDSDYWKKFVGELVGDWLGEKTSVKEICDFCDKVYLQKNLNGFKGDTGFAKNEGAQKTFSKLRSSLAGVYVWRVQHAKDDDEKSRMRKAADLAFRQAFALCPNSPEVVFRYIAFLMDTKRTDEAILIAKTALQINPTNESLKELLQSLENMKESLKPRKFDLSSCRMQLDFRHEHG
ncbi:MAG: hypothetical protein M3Y82_09245 [Verrucomicrobiota bacterium]|nr:hypothetical protein [Verrucomicrobiota bacterium]